MSQEDDLRKFFLEELELPYDDQPEFWDVARKELDKLRGKKPSPKITKKDFDCALANLSTYLGETSDKRQEDNEKRGNPNCS